MAKRMIDTDLWNNEDIIEMFTAEDRYFWLYLLTNPHNSICGVMKASPVLMARDMGYSKECINNLLYRFENVHKAIAQDIYTKEIIILNWGKFNWNKSRDVRKSVEANFDKIQSQKIKDILREKVDTFEWTNKESKDRVSTGCQQGTITNTITNTNNIVEDLSWFLDKYNIQVDSYNGELGSYDFKKLDEYMQKSSWLRDYIKCTSTLCKLYHKIMTGQYNDMKFKATDHEEMDDREYLVKVGKFSQEYVDGLTDEEVKEKAIKWKKLVGEIK